MSEHFELERLLGAVHGKRIIELGCGNGHRAVALARAGATVIAIDPSSEAVISARRRAIEDEVRIEAHTGDFADLAFLRGDSVDVAFAEGSLAGLADLGRVFRQVQRVLRAGAWFAFSLPHPVGFCVSTDPDPEGSLPLTRKYFERSYFEADPVGGAYPHPIAGVFAALGRAGFRVDLILEPEPAPGPLDRALVPVSIVWRARKVGS